MPGLIRQDDLLLRLIKDVGDIRSALRRTIANIPLFDISNENTPAQITADQNDYVPGNFDVLRLSTDAPRTITGFRGGVKGRFLRLFNIGTYEITVAHQSGSSLLGNRVVSPTGFDLVINAGGQLVLYYDITRSVWISSYATNADRISCRLRRTVKLDIADSVDTVLPWETAVFDTGGFWDVANPGTISIPESGWYDFHAQIVWNDNGDPQDDRYVGIVDNTGYFIAIDSRHPGTNGVLSPLFQPAGRPIYMTRGQYVQVILFNFQFSGLLPAAVESSVAWFGGTAFTEFNVVKL